MRYLNRTFSRDSPSRPLRVRYGRRVKSGAMMAVGLALLAGLGWALLSRPTVSAVATPEPLERPSQRYYSATGQVMGLKAMGARGCEVTVKLHQWSSISAGFGLAEIPQKGQMYTLSANPNQCLAVEVALAAQNNPNDLKSPRHINYKARQQNQGPWYFAENPTAPVGCAGL